MFINLVELVKDIWSINLKKNVVVENASIPFNIAHKRIK